MKVSTHFRRFCNISFSMPNVITCHYTVPHPTAGRNCFPPFEHFVSGVPPFFYSRYLILLLSSPFDVLVVGNTVFFSSFGEFLTKKLKFEQVSAASTTFDCRGYTPTKKRWKRFPFDSKERGKHLCNGNCKQCY